MLQTHFAIIDPVVFDQVQRELAQRKPGARGRKNGVCTFSGMVRCGECGAWYGSKTWHSTDKYKRVVWQCNRKYSKANGAPCRTPHLSDQQLQTAFTVALREAIGGRDKALR